MVLNSKYGLDFTTPNPNSVLDAIDDVDLACATVNTYRTVLKQYLMFKDFEIDEKLKERLGYRTGQPKRTLRPKDLLTKDDVVNIIEHSNSPVLRAYYATLYDSGARPSGILKLNVGDVVQDKWGYTVTLHHVKNEQSRRTIRLLDPTMIRYFEQHWSRVAGDPPDSALFKNSRGKRYKAKTIGLYLWKHHRPRLNRPINLYLFRKSRATQLLKEKKFSGIELKMRMGHKKHSQMLEQYYAILDEDDQAQAELKYLGYEVEGDPISPQLIFCTNCGAACEHDAQRCQRCRMPLTELELIRGAPPPEWKARINAKDVKTMLYKDRKTTLYQPTSPDELVAMAQSLLELAKTMQKTK